MVDNAINVYFYLLLFCVNNQCKLLFIWVFTKKSWDYNIIAYMYDYKHLTYPWNLLGGIYISKINFCHRVTFPCKSLGVWGLFGCTANWHITCVFYQRFFPPVRYSYIIYIILIISLQSIAWIPKYFDWGKQLQYDNSMVNKGRRE